MRDIERSASPLMPETLDELIADVKVRWQKDDATQFYGFIILCLQYLMYSYSDDRDAWKRANSERSAGQLVNAVPLCKLYYNETGSAIFSKICTALGVRCEMHPVREEHFQLIASVEEIAQEPSLLGKRPIDNVLHRLEEEEADLRSRPDTRRSSLTILKDDLLKAFGDFIDRSIP